MADKKLYVEPKILTDTDLETAGKDFPLMPMTTGSGGSTDAADGNDAPQPDPAFDGTD